MSTPTGSEGTRARMGAGGAAGLIVLLYLLDQGTKWLVMRNIPYDGERSVVPGFFTLVHWHNTGAAFSMLSRNNGLFIGLSLLTLVCLAFFAVRGAFQQPIAQWAVCLLSAGVLGNVTDRIAHGHVIDFLLFDLHVRFASPWPAFNVADSCICVAAVLFVLAGWADERRARQAAV